MHLAWFLIAVCAGFNEAPIHESGKSERSGCHSATTRLCFNEAPIHESGKWPSAPYAGKWTRRFNEAPIHESGKFAKRLSE